MGMNKFLFDIWKIEQRGSTVKIILEKKPSTVTELEYETTEDAQVAFDAVWRTMEAVNRMNEGSVRSLEKKKKVEPTEKKPKKKLPVTSTGSSG